MAATAAKSTLGGRRAGLATCPPGRISHDRLAQVRRKRGRERERERERERGKEGAGIGRGGTGWRDGRVEMGRTRGGGGGKRRRQRQRRLSKKKYREAAIPSTDPSMRVQQPSGEVKTISYTYVYVYTCPARIFFWVPVPGIFFIFFCSFLLQFLPFFVHYFFFFSGAPVHRHETVRVRPSAVSLGIFSHLTALLRLQLPTGVLVVGDQSSSYFTPISPCHYLPTSLFSLSFRFFSCSFRTCIRACCRRASTVSISQHSTTHKPCPKQQDN